TGVLNLNNMRDIDNDLASGKRTLAAKMGFAKAKKYHAFLIVIGIFSIVGMSFPLYLNIWAYVLLLLPVLILTKDLQQILKTKDKATLDPFLKKLALGTFIMSVVFVLSLVISK
ncbi:MAG: UbiA family prenyltransferase, partial [Bacteroidales bacterium]|nr:UbiA family prenyltransferase [Bacteroidales bacterium]